MLEELESREAHTRNQISGILLFHIIVIIIIRVLVCYNKVIQL